jgi:predicted permease
MRSHFRLLAKHPGFTAVAVLTMAIAIGANTALFSVMNAVVLRPLDFPQPDSIVRYWARNAERNLDAPVMFWSKWQDLQANQTVFSQLAISVFNNATITDGSEPEQVPTLLASVDFLPMLGLTPQLGRVFTADEDKEGAPHVALISQRLWEQKFSKAADVLGQKITLDGVPYTIIGVLPRMPVPFNTAEIVHPRPYEVSFLGANRDFAGVWQVTARLKPGVAHAAAEAQVLDLHKRFIATRPTHPDATNIPRLRTLADEVYGNLNATFWVLAGAVAAVLLIACANIANLALARLSARQKEIAVRVSLGATRGAIVRQFLGESLLLAVLGGALGILIASWSLEGIRLLAGQQLPRASDISLDLTVLGFATGVTALTALLVGIYPALQASRTDVQVVLKDAGRGNVGTQGKTFRNALIVTEVALSMVLLVCAGLLIASFINLQRTQLGFDPARVAGGNLNLPASKYNKPELTREFYRLLQEKIDTAPELAGGGATSVMPLTQSASFSPFSVHGRSILPIPERPLAGIRVVTTGYFSGMGMQFAEGRGFTAEDRPLPPAPAAGAPSPGTGVCVINEQLARKLFPGASAVGQILLFGPNSDARFEIVGVLRNIKTAGVSQPIPDEIYFPRSQRGGSFMTVVARARPGLTADGVLPVLRRLVREIDPTVPLAQPATAEQLVRQSVAVQRLMMTLLLAFAGIAALLAAVGIYSVMAYSVARRTGEIGVRMALGATASHILGLVLRGAALLLGGGLVLGLGGAFAASRLLQQSLYEVNPFDPLVFAAVSAFFILVAALACLLPARRAIRVNPLDALRAE